MHTHKASAFLLALICLGVSAGTGAQAPEYKFDPEWPQLPLPNKWWMQGVTGLYVDHEDNIWVLNRPSNLNNTEDYAQLDPPTGICCVAPPALIAFDFEGNVIESWDTQEGHGMTVDTEGHVWIGQETVRKYTLDGTLVAEVASLSMRVIDKEQGKLLLRSRLTPDYRAATPTVILLDASGRDVGCWVERPSELQTWFQEHKRTLEHDDLYGQKYEWYEKDAGQSTLREIVELLEAAAVGQPMKCYK